MYIREGVPNGVINWPIWEYTVIDFQIYKWVPITPLGRGVPNVHHLWRVPDVHQGGGYPMYIFSQNREPRVNTLL